MVTGLTRPAQPISKVSHFFLFPSHTSFPVFWPLLFWDGPPESAHFPRRYWQKPLANGLLSHSYAFRTCGHVPRPIACPGRCLAAIRHGVAEREQQLVFLWVPGAALPVKEAVGVSGWVMKAFL